MAFETSSPNMNLVLPSVGLTSGSQWATDVNASLTIIDQHNHSSGSGVPITPSGLNINSDLSFGVNNATGLRSVRFSSQAGVLSAAADLGCLYEVGADLYYRDGSGNNIRITQSGGIVGTPGSISGLSSPATATYNSAASTFVWQSGASTAANLDAGSLLMRNLSPNSTFALTLQPPAALAANYSLTLPSVPGATSFMTINSSGVISPGPAIAAGIVSANIAAATILGSNIAATTITGSNMVNGTVGTTQLANASVTQAKRAALGQQVSSSSGTYSMTSSTFTTVPNQTVTLTTTGRPVWVGLAADGTSNVAAVETGVTGGAMTLQFLRDGTPISVSLFGTAGVSNNAANIPPSSFWFLDTGASAASHTYTVQVKSNNGSDTVTVNYCALVAFEL